MPAPARTPNEIVAAVHAGRGAEARDGLQRLKSARPNDPMTWVCAAEVECALGCFGEMLTAAERAAKLRAPEHLCNLMRAHAEFGCGRVEAGIEFARKSVAGLSGDQLAEAQLALCEGLFLANRNDELAAVLAGNPALGESPRGQLHLARVARRSGHADRAEALFRAVFQSSAPLAVRRTAGFECAKLLDGAGRFADAFEMAAATHAATSVRFDTRGMVREVERCASLAERGGFRVRAKPSRRVERTALVCSLPRSGTTLIEQMLDRHPAICGLGEIPAVEQLASEITAFGGWPEGISMAETKDLDRLQAGYLGFVRSLSRAAPTVTTLDKTIHTWRRIPAIAAALPGAKLIRIKRDARDNAISIFLSNFHRETMGWAASLEEIRQVIEAERRFVPVIAKALEVDLLEIDYQALVADPRRELTRALEFLGLPWEEACLHPDANRRVVITLSHEQVRRPVNSDSLGRWRNYAERFDARWESLDSH